MKTLLLVLASLITYQATIRFQEARAGAFESLPPEQQRLVKERYRDILNAQEKRNFAAMSAAADTILSLVPDYHDTRAYQAIALKGLEDERANQGVSEVVRREIRLRTIAALEVRGQSLLKKARTDVDARVSLYRTMEELQKLDRDNEYPAEWKKRLRED